MDRYRDLVIGDIRWCKENGVDYVPAVTPDLAGIISVSWSSRMM